MNFQEDVLNVNGKVLVDFYTQMCGPCRMMAPVVDELSNTFAVRKVDAGSDDGAMLAAEYNVQAVPTFIVFENGREVSRKVGYTDKATLFSMMEG